MAVQLTGKRYVFFNSCINSTIPEVQAAVSAAKTDLATIGNTLKSNGSYENSTQKDLDNIGKYLKFIKSMADSLESNEIAFLQQQFQQLPPNCTLKKFFPQLSGLSQLPDDLKYPALMNAFDGLMQDKDLYLKSMQVQKEKMEGIKARVSQRTEAQKKELETLYEENFNKYKSVLLSKDFINEANSSIAYQSFATSLSTELANRANQAIKLIASNDELLDLITKSINKSGSITASNALIVEKIVNIVADTVINKPLDIPVDDIVKTIHQNFVNSAEAELKKIDEIEYAHILIKDYQEFEEMALTTDESLGQQILLYDDKSIQNLKDNYSDAADAITDLIRLKKEQASETTIKNKARTVTRLLRQAVINKAQDKLKDPTITKMTKQDFRERLKNVSNFITRTNLETSLKSLLKDIDFTHDAIGEILASNDVQQRIIGAIVNNLPGVSITFKSDIRFATQSFSTANFSDSIKVADILNPIIKNNYTTFFSKYKEKSGGQTNIKLAMDAYDEWMLEMKKQIDKEVECIGNAEERLKMRHKLYEEMYKTFSTSISVKDYELYNNDLGFHGGSLGGSKSPSQVLDNILTMYELGGLSDLDTKTLLFAVVNCGEAMIGNNLKPALEDFLLGGAALIMFDDSFAASEEFLKRAVDNFKGQRIVNIYRLNTKYVPASIVLNEIYNNLVLIYQDIERNTALSQIKHRSKVAIVNNITEDSLDQFHEGKRAEAAKKNKTYNIPSYSTWQQKWEAIYDFASHSVSITFSFMGGLLDTLDRMPSAFQIK